MKNVHSQINIFLPQMIVRVKDMYYEGVLTTLKARQKKDIAGTLVYDELYWRVNLLIHEVRFRPELNAI
jgi:hypothetical protein